MNNFIEILQKEFQNDDTVIKENISMKDYTSFKTGGNAAVGIFPTTAEALSRIVRLVRDKKYCVLGNGSNVLFPDSGYDGAIIFTTAMKDVSVDGEVITAQCGAGITGTASIAYKNGLAGLEFAYGIPGSVGGAVFMNAGAYEGDMSQVVLSSTYVDENGDIFTLDAPEHEFSYRHSAYMKGGKIVTDCRMKLKAGDKTAIKAKMDENMFKRRDKQPLEYPNAGSIFKRPPDNFAGKLVSECGLKGYTIGGAQVSEKHAGFIINIGNATTDDVLRLIEHCRSEVLRQFGVELECEVRYIC